MQTIDYPPRLELARLPTPLQPLQRLSQELGGPKIWLKRDDLTDCAVSGNKIRKLEFTLARAMEQGCDTLITCGGEQSNHCRATAILGARLGLKVHLILRRERVDASAAAEGAAQCPDGNLFLDYLCGAHVSIYDKPEYQHRLPELFEHWAAYYNRQGYRPYLIPTGASDGTGVWGYVACAEELSKDFQRVGIDPAYIVHATGSGGTQAGLTAGSQLFRLGASVLGIAVCDNADYFSRKVAEDLRQWRESYGLSVDIAESNILVDDRYVGPGYAQADAAVYQTIRQVAASEGVVLDPVYTGKAFYGMIDRIKRGEFAGARDIVFVHTGGIFGLLAQRSRMSEWLTEAEAT